MQERTIEETRALISQVKSEAEQREIAAEVARPNIDNREGRRAARRATRKRGRGYTR